MKVLEHKEVMSLVHEDHEAVLLVAIEDTEGLAGYGKGKVYRVEHYFLTDSFDDSCSFFLGRYSGVEMNINKVNPALYTFAKEKCTAIAQKRLKQKNAPVRKDTGTSKTKIIANTTQNERFA